MQQQAEEADFIVQKDVSHVDMLRRQRFLPNRSSKSLNDLNKFKSELKTPVEITCLDPGEKKSLQNFLRENYDITEEPPINSPDSPVLITISISSGRKQSLSEDVLKLMFALRKIQRRTEQLEAEIEQLKKLSLKNIIKKWLFCSDIIKERKVNVLKQLKNEITQFNKDDEKNASITDIVENIRRKSPIVDYGFFGKSRTTLMLDKIISRDSNKPDNSLETKQKPFERCPPIPNSRRGTAAPA